MNTPTHLILHAVIRKYSRDKKNITLPRSFLLWAIAPDILLYLFVFSYIPLSIYVFWNSSDYTFSHMFDTLYFEHPLWIFGYNILHSPTTLLILFILLYTLRKHVSQYYTILKWFLIWCALHSLFDIPLHHDDGPRVFYPFFDYTFSSPVSYWDFDHHGRIVSFIEWWALIVGFIYLFWLKIRKKISL